MVHELLGKGAVDGLAGDRHAGEHDRAGDVGEQRARVLDAGAGEHLGEPRALLGDDVLLHQPGELRAGAQRRQQAAGEEDFVEQLPGLDGDEREQVASQAAGVGRLARLGVALADRVGDQLRLAIGQRRYSVGLLAPARCAIASIVVRS